MNNFTDGPSLSEASSEHFLLPWLSSCHGRRVQFRGQGQEGVTFLEVFKQRDPAL